MSSFLVIVSLVSLYLSKNLLVSQLTRFIHHLGGGQRGTIITWSIIFLPGTIIHEISHFLLAALTGARTGKVEIFPEYLEDDLKNNKRGGVALGYVQTQSLNPIRGFLVGVAPFVSGIALLIYLSFLIQNSFSQNNYQTLALESYLFFTIANSFFPSWSDIKQTIPLILISLIIAIIAWYFGFHLLFYPSPQILSLIDSLYLAVFASVGINLIIICFLFIANKIFNRN